MQLFVCSGTFRNYRFPLFFTQEIHDTKMTFLLRKLKPRFLFYILCIFSIGGLSLYSVTMAFHTLRSNEPSDGCSKDVDSLFGKMINESPKPFLSLNDTVPEEDFIWWKVNINSSLEIHHQYPFSVTAVYRGVSLALIEEKFTGLVT